MEAFHGQAFHKGGISGSCCVRVIALGRLQEDRQAIWDFFKEGLGQGFPVSVHLQELVASTEVQFVRPKCLDCPFREDDGQLFSPRYMHVLSLLSCNSS